MVALDHVQMDAFYESLLRRQSTYQWLRKLAPTLEHSSHFTELVPVQVQPVGAHLASATALVTLVSPRYAPNTKCECICSWLCLFSAESVLLLASEEMKPPRGSKSLGKVRPASS